MSLGSLTPEPEFLTHAMLPISLCMSHIRSTGVGVLIAPQEMSPIVAMMAALVRNRPALHIRERSLF